MARIPEHEIERIKSEISLVRLVEASGVELKRQGKDFFGRCPWHADKTPSLSVSPESNLWHCLGACQVGGSVIDWTMKLHGVSFRHAMELLREDSPLAAVPAQPVKHSTVRKLAAPVAFDADDRTLLRQVIDYYHDTLQHSPEALAYLKARGLEHPQLIEHFRLGFANRTLGLRLPATTRKAGAELRGALQRIGIVRASGHEHFNGSLVIPVIDEHGEVSEIYGRKIRDDLREGTPYHLYLPGPHRGVWNAAALGTAQEIILCEALIDALTFWCAGFRNVTTSYGVEGFTADHLAAFQSHGIERVLIAYDRDPAGDRAADKLAAQLNAAGLDAYRIEFPKGIDANEYALKVGPAHKSLGVAIRAAQWLGKGKAKPIRTASAGIPVLTVECARDPSPEPVLPLVAKSVPPATPSAVENALPAQALPEAPAPLPVAESKTLGHEREYVLVFGARRYRVRGLEKNLSHEILKVNLLASAPALGGGGESSGNAVHVDTLDLYQARARTAFVKSAAIELGVAEEIVKGDIGKVLLALEMEQEKLITAAQTPKAPAVVAIDEAARARAMALLTRADLIECIASDFSRAGIVGERTNALVGYLAAVSRKLERPLALLLQSSSAAGKSSLMDAVLKFVPEEDRIVYSAMTGQSLFYMGEMDLKHKILAIAEEAGAARASYALKLLQSEGELTIASTSKDAATGKLTTDEYHVEGPVMIFSTTTAAEIDEELKNRCLVLGVDESREQTQAIHAVQRERRTLVGLHAKAEREAIFKTHQDAQRLLEPLAVMNPYAHRLTFINDRTRTRRDHEKYLTLIDVIALLHQHQREINSTAHSATATRYVEVTLDDIALANSLAHEVLGRTLDELPPQTRVLLSFLVGMVERECTAQGTRRVEYRFSRRQVREHTRWGDTQLKIHLARLVELEYLLIHRGGRGQSFEYELLYDGVSDEAPHLSGLIDVGVLRTASALPMSCDYDAQRSGQNAHRSGVGRPLVGPQSGAGRAAQHHLNADKTNHNDESSAPEPKTHGTGNGTKPPSYPRSPLAAAGLR